MTNRMTWDEICKEYPNQQVGLSDVEYGPGRIIISAVVKMHEDGNTTKTMINSEVVRSNGEMISENTAQKGVYSVGVWTL